MSKVCPACNKLENITYTCPQCNGVMVDKGRAQDYVDPYAGQYPINDGENYCIHVFQCLNCNEMEKKKVPKTEV